MRFIISKFQIVSFFHSIIFWFIPFITNSQYFRSLKFYIIWKINYQILDLSSKTITSISHHNEAFMKRNQGIYLGWSTKKCHLGVKSCYLLFVWVFLDSILFCRVVSKAPNTLWPGNLLPKSNRLTESS